MWVLKAAIAVKDLHGTLVWVMGTALICLGSAPLCGSKGLHWQSRVHGIPVWVMGAALTVLGRYPHAGPGDYNRQ